MSLFISERLRLGARRKRLWQHRFARSVGIMLLGTASGQAISLLLSPALTRLFTPSQFGALSVYNATLMICVMVASLGYEMAIPICLNERDYLNLTALCWTCLAVVFALLALVSGLAPAAMFSLTGLDPLLRFRYLIPIGLAWLGAYFILLAMATRAGNFGVIARTRVLQGATGPTSQVLFGLLGLGGLGLIAGFILGQAAATLQLLRHFAPAVNAARGEISWRGMAAIARRYRRFPLFASWSRLLDVAGSGDILFVLIAACYSTEVAGFMFLSERIVVRPLTMISTSLLQVFTGEAGRAISEDPGQLNRRFRQVIPAQFLLAGAWILAANAVAGWVFPLLFGSHWALAVPYLRALSLSYLVQVTLHPVSNTLLLLERQAMDAAWQICRLFLIVAAVLLPWHLGVSALGVLWISSGVQAACCLALLGFMLTAIEQLKPLPKAQSPMLR